MTSKDCLRERLFSLGAAVILLAAGVSAISWNFLFIDPRFTFQISRLQDIILLSLYFVIALFTGNLTARIRTQAQQARFNLIQRIGAGVDPAATRGGLSGERPHRLDASQ